MFQDLSVGTTRYVWNQGIRMGDSKDEIMVEEDMFGGCLMLNAFIRQSFQNAQERYVYHCHRQAILEL